MSTRVLKSVNRVLASSLLALIPIALAAQVAPGGHGSGPPLHKWDIFVGYSYFAPNAVVTGEVPAKADCVGSRASSVTLTGDGNWSCPVGMEAEVHGSVESLTRNLNSRVGIQIDAAQHDVYYNDPSQLESNSGMYSIQAGPVYRFPRPARPNWTPWIHGLAGGGELQGPDHQNYTPGFTCTAGGGVDYETPWLNHGVAIRIVDADYEYMRVRYGGAHLSSSNGWQPGGIANFDKGFRLSAGIVFHLR